MSRKVKTRSDRDLLRMLYAVRGIAESHLKQVANTNFHRFEDVVERTRSDLTRVITQTDRLIAMLEQRFQHADDEKTETSSQSSIRESVEDVMKILHDEYSFDRVTVVKILPHNLPPIPVTREHLDIMLFELLSQARRAIGRSGGIMTIEAEEEWEPSPEHQNEHRFKIHVSDTGPLIPEGDLEHVFDPVFEARSYRFEDGVGLYNVRRILERYHGAICVENRFRYASFHLEIPAHN